MRHEPRSRTACTRTPSTSAPRAPPSPTPSRRATARGPPRHGPWRSPRRCAARCRRRVHLVRVVQLDDLGGLEVRARPSRRTHPSTARQPEVRGDEHAERRCRPSPSDSSARRASARRRPSRWCRPRRARRRRAPRARWASVTAGIVKSTATSAPGASRRVSVVQPGDQLEAVGGLDARARLGAHPPGRAEHRHLDVVRLTFLGRPARIRPPPSGRTPESASNGPRTA